MLYLSRKIGESIVINNTITVTVVEVRGKTVKLGFSYPSEATVLRKEVHDRISDENATASAIHEGMLDFDIDIDMALEQDQPE